MITTVRNADRQAVLTGGPSVLVVDIEPSVRRFIGVLLQVYGYRAITAADGVEARAAVEMEDIAVILCNVHLRGESGQALVADLRRQSPGTIVLMMSDSDEPDLPNGTGEARLCGRIPRPLHMIKRIAQVLCGRRVGAESASGADRLWRPERHEVINA
jgi:two-component system cell cycle sensor histidine kinase/response regulator CckA